MAALVCAASAAVAPSVSGVQFYVTNAAKNAGIANPVVCIIRGVTVSKETSTVYDPLIEDLEKRVQQIRLDVIESEEVKGFRELYKSIGSKVKPAGENLIDGVIRRKAFPRYNNIVDAPNTVTCNTGVPFGVHDARAIENTCIILRRAEGTERMVPSFETKEQSIPKGDFTYGIRTESGFSPFAWLGQKDKDNSIYQVKETTKEILVTAPGHAKTTQDRNVDLCNQIFDRIKMSCPDATLEILEPIFVDSEEEIPLHATQTV